MPTTEDTWEPRAGQPHPLDAAFYRLTTDQRDRAWRREEELVEDLRDANLRIQRLEDFVESVNGALIDHLQKVKEAL